MLSVCFGQYAWCGNSSDSKYGTGYFLSDIPEETSYMLHIDVPLQSDFTWVSCNWISNRIYYTPQTQILFFPIHKSVLGQTIHVTYSHSWVKPLSFSCPVLLEKGDTKDCAICLSALDSKSHHCSCGHRFHEKCLWNYLRHTVLPAKLDSCKEIFTCKHVEKVRWFSCPVCRQEVL